MCPSGASPWSIRAKILATSTRRSNHVLGCQDAACRRPSHQMQRTDSPLSPLACSLLQKPAYPSLFSFSTTPGILVSLQGHRFFSALQISPYCFVDTTKGSRWWWLLYLIVSHVFRWVLIVNAITVLGCRTDGLMDGRTCQPFLSRPFSELMQTVYWALVPKST